MTRRRSLLATHDGVGRVRKARDLAAARARRAAEAEFLAGETFRLDEILDPLVPGPWSLVPREDGTRDEG